ncbi:Processing alpha glucosidase I [Lobosporangium transversale]|nr:Processing alpha glucosidase I [Lobosporangium transversale]
MSIAALYYIGIDGEGELEIDTDNFVAQSPIKFDGNAKDLGNFDFAIEQTKGDNKHDSVHFFGATIPRGNIWRAKDFVREVIIHQVQAFQQMGRTDLMPKELFSLPNQFFGGQPNFIIFQMHYDAPFEFEVRFNSKSSPNIVTSTTITKELAKAISAFDERFEKTFHLKQQGYSNSMIDFAKAAMSNLIGGIGYFYGSSIIDESPMYEEGSNEHLEGPVARRPSPDPQYTPPASLFTATPSRSFFPRGFYWDEGFHQTLIGQWDNDLSLEIIESWFNRQNDDGWIQREQILGDEARSRVPPEFQVQYPEHANPPTLFKAINLYLDRLKNVNNTFSVNEHSESEHEQKQQTSFSTEGIMKSDVTNARLMNTHLASDYLARLYPKLRTNYFWMRSIMRGRSREYGHRHSSAAQGYRWRGRTKTHTLTSGLDDYPRAPLPSVWELHVDLLCWIGFMNRNLLSIAKIVEEEEDVEEFEEHYYDIVADVDGLHWNEEHKAYCDLTVDENDASIHVCHKGYISLFPMLLGIIDPKSEKLGHILDLMSDPEELWSPFGLRSLSIKDEFFGTGENYWKGPIWAPINYLALHSLKENYMVEGPYQAKVKEIFNNLRDNLINNIFNEYERTGYVWEQYNDTTGHGQRSHPFTGWTSMVVLMMQMGRAE